MTSISEVAALFPLRTINEVVRLFSQQCDGLEPDLVLLSIVAGYIENSMSKVNEVNLTSEFKPGLTSMTSEEDTEPDVTTANLKIEPQVNWHYIESLYKKFEAVIRGYCDPSLLESAKKPDAEPQIVRKLIKHVSDIIWNTLSKAQYKDRPHLQSVYSYLTGNKLDCFGVAFAVVAGCQLLEVPGVHLALSEDHAWVVFGPDGTETAEVTWHGKGNEDKRGQPVDIIKAKTSWLYVAGQPVVCDRHMEVAALVSSINPAINSNYDSIEIGALQQELLWLLYDQGFLKQYPMALGNLGDLEEIAPSIGRPSSLRLFEEAIEVNRRVYNNHHVYPYTYLAGYYYRMKEFNKALETWANAADVIKLYSYSKDDEEIYKEFMEIANELIPHVIKAEDPKVQGDPICYAHILRFYDGICCWEEGSTTPVMHIGWAKPMVSTCTKFEAKVRKRVELPPEVGNTETEMTSEDELWVNNNYYKTTFETNDCDEAYATSPDSTKSHVTTGSHMTGNHVTGSHVTGSSSAKDQVLSLLSEYCHSKVLNLDYLLGLSAQPFLNASSKGAATIPTSINATSISIKRPHLISGSSTGSPSTGSLLSPSGASDSSMASSTTSMTSRIMLRLFSAKMIGLKDLLSSEKLNTNAIQLQLTALSQVTTSKPSVASDSTEFGGRPKRSRRE